MSEETLAQIADALSDLMGPLEFHEWIRKCHPSGDEMRERRQQLADERAQRDKGFLHRWVTGMFG